MTDKTTRLRDAASLILLRQSEGCLRVLMGVRNAGHRFMPNHMVFPGGGVDLEDYTAPVASPLRPEVMERLQRAAAPDLAAGLGHAAARELEEETGLSLGHPPALAGLDYLCRAETPPDRSIRFNARFFVADGGLVTGALGGSGELETLDWYDVEEMLKLDLAAATRAVLGRLRIWLALDPAARVGGKVPVLREREWVEE